MQTEVVVALIASAVGVIGSITALIVGLRGVKVEREKLQIEREHLRSEIVKLEAETEKLRVEVDDARQQRLEERQANLEIEKQKALALLESQKSIYPEMLELVYRLRNDLRDNLNCLELQTEESFRGTPPLGEELYLLTENLYKYRAFIDERTFQMLHRYKRLLQDAQVIFNRITRPPNSPPIGNSRDHFEELSRMRFSLYQESAEHLGEVYSAVDKLYPQITQNVQEHIQTVLTR